jgi:hypothetical protein
MPNAVGISGDVYGSAHAAVACAIFFAGWTIGLSGDNTHNTSPVFNA